MPPRPLLSLTSPDLFAPSPRGIPRDARPASDSASGAVPVRSRPRELRRSPRPRCWTPSSSRSPLPACSRWRNKGLARPDVERPQAAPTSKHLSREVPPDLLPRRLQVPEAGLECARPAPVPHWRTAARPPAVEGRRGQGPGTAGRGRGAPVRSEAQGAAQGAPPVRGRPDAHRDAHPPHPSPLLAGLRDSR